MVQRQSNALVNATSQRGPDAFAWDGRTLVSGQWYPSTPPEPR